MRILAALGATGGLALAAMLGVPPGALRARRARKGPPPRPGPAILYQKPASAPQLENERGSPWHAPSIFVSGASAYRQGEVIYQGFLYHHPRAQRAHRPPHP